MVWWSFRHYLGEGGSKWYSPVARHPTTQNHWEDERRTHHSHHKCEYRWDGQILKEIFYTLSFWDTELLAISIKVYRKYLLFRDGSIRFVQVGHVSQIFCLGTTFKPISNHKLCLNQKKKRDSLIRILFSPQCPALVLNITMSLNLLLISDWLKAMLFKNLQRCQTRKMS